MKVRLQRRLETAVVNPFFVYFQIQHVFVFFLLEQDDEARKMIEFNSFARKIQFTFRKAEVEIWMFSQKLVQVMHIFESLRGFSSFLF